MQFEGGWTSLVSSKGNALLREIADDEDTSGSDSDDDGAAEGGPEEAPAAAPAAPPKKSMRRRMSVALGVSPRDDEPLKVRAQALAEESRLDATRTKCLVSHR